MCIICKTFVGQSQSAVNTIPEGKHDGGSV